MRRYSGQLSADDSNCYLEQQAKKGEAGFVADNHQKAILHLYANGPVIDGTKIKAMEHIRGTDLQFTVALEPGKHNIRAKYSISEPSMGKNVNYSTPKPIDSEINLEAGHEYALALYFYSPEQRRNYYKGDVGEDVFNQTLKITSGGFGGHKDAYIICYKEK